MMTQSIGYLLKCIQYTLRQSLDNTLREIGLTTPQYSALMALDLNPDASNADLARACFVTPQTMIKILQGLEQAGFISRHPHTYNRRIIVNELTPAAVIKLIEAQGRVDQIENRMQVGLTDREHELLAGLLSRFYKNLTTSDKH